MSEAPWSALKQRQQGTTKGKAAPMKVACDRCSEKKIACDGTRPICRQCEQTNSICRFETRPGESRSTARRRELDALQKDNEDLRQTTRALRYELDRLNWSSPSGMGQGDVESTTGSSTMVESPPPTSSIHGTIQPDTLPVKAAFTSDLFHQALQQSSYGTFPARFSALEFELMVRHPAVYLQFSPASIDNLYLRPLNETRILFWNIDFLLEEIPLEDDELDSSSGLHLPPGVDWPRPSLKDAHCDPRLEKLEIGIWSRVVISTQLAARLISLYLETDHPLLGFFDADLFLDGLIGQGNGLCSCLLVNAVLLWSCHSYAALEERTSSFKQLFFSETLRLWYGEDGGDPTLKLAAALFLNMTSVCCGDDGLADNFLREAQKIGEDLALFGIPEGISHLEDHEISVLRARSHTAWGLFNYMTLHATCYRDLYMGKIPRYPIPGDQFALCHAASNGVAVFHSLPDFMGNTFSRLCKLWLIVNEVILASSALNQPASEPTFTIEFVESIFQRLLHWVDTFALLESRHRLHHEDVFDIYFHSAVLDLFRPLVALDYPLRTFSSQHKTSKDVFVASTNQLKRHVLEYPSKHASAAYSMLWHTALLQVANAALNDLGNSKSQLFLLLCVRRYHDLSVGFPIMSSIGRGLLGIAARDGALSQHDARLIVTRLREINRSITCLDHPAGAFLVDLNLAMTNSSSAQARHLFNEF